MPAQGRPSKGDVTGNQRAAQQKQARLDDQERSAEAAVATAVQTEDERLGVFDAQSGERLDTPAPVSVRDLPDEPRFFQPAEDDDEPVLTGQEDPEHVAQVVAARKAYTRPPVQQTRDAFVVVRVDQDIENMTYGMTPSGEPNNFTFKEGMQYKVSLDVADHLNDRGLVRQWGKSSPR